MIKQRGAALVEATITTLLLFALLLGIMEFGRAYNIYQVATNAAREGARFAVAPLAGTNTLPSTDEVIARVKSFLDSSNIRCPEGDDCVTITTPTQTVSAPGGAVPLVYTRVSVSVPYNFITPQLLGVRPSIRLRTSATMRNETN